MIGVRIHEGENVTDVYLNLRADGRRMHVNSNNAFDGWETDAYLVAVTRRAGSNENDPDSAERYFVACGSYLRKQGKIVLDSLSKIYTVFTVGKPEMDVLLQGQPVIRASLRTIPKPQRIRLNGQKTAVAYNESKGSVKLRLDRR